MKQELPIYSNYVFCPIETKWENLPVKYCKEEFEDTKWFQARRFLEFDQPETIIAYGGYAC
jgi:hypothetical protein